MPDEDPSANAARRSLYVRRPLKNGDELRDWALAQGFTNTLEPGDMHVTVAYSKRPVDWTVAGDHFDDVRANNPDGRKVARLGDDGATVLMFRCPELKQRWRQFRAAGASWDHSGYHPHVTISYDGAPADLSTVIPFLGALVFGSEIYDEIDPDRASVNKWIAETFDHTGRAVAMLERDGYQAIDKSSDHPGGTDLHIKPENAVLIETLPRGLPVADIVTRANVQHASWEMAREGKPATKRVVLPLDVIIATQQVVDKERVAKHQAKLLEGQGIEPKQKSPLTILWDGDYFLLGGHHGLQAAKNLGIKEVTVDLMVAPD